MWSIRVTLLLVVLSAAGCATMNPYIQHSRDVSDVNINECAATERVDKALHYACSMAIRMEKSRAEIISTRSGLTAAIFPLVGIIGYNSARGINAPTNAALTAGGFAGYSAITTLAQPDRIRVYDNGLRSTYCAIGVYQAGLASAPAENASRKTLGREAQHIRRMISAAKQNPNGNSARTSQLESLNSNVMAMEDWLHDSHPNRGSSAQLLAYTRIIVAKVNSHLTLTVPDNKQLVGDALSTLQTGAGQPDGGSSELRSKADTGLLSVNVKGKVIAVDDAEMDAINAALEELVDLYDQLVANASFTTTTLNFKDCDYAELSDIGVENSISRFMLGPNDYYSGRTVTVVRGTTPFEATISGGVLPYTATVNRVDGTDAVEAKIDGGKLTVTVPGKAGPESSYQVIVNDATNRYAKSVLIKVLATP
jgi:hypothetical protein